METVLSTEIELLGWSVVLLILQVMAQSSANHALGLPYLFSARDEDRKPNGVLASRLKRALANLLETYPAFVALALGLAVTGKTGGIAATGAAIYLACRVLYVAVYAAGIPVIRTVVWLASMVGLILMTVRLLG